MAMDCDPDALARSKSLSEEFGESFNFIDSAFQNLDKYSSEEEFDGILLDLGISSFQLAEARKGFSFRLDAPIDMRLDPREGISAAEFLETASRESLIRRFGTTGKSEDG